MAADMFRKQMHSDESFRTCSLCSEPYDNEGHQAKLLPCLHTFCKSCVHSNEEDFDFDFDCEHCHKTINFPGGSVDKLPDNFLVQNLQQHQDEIKRAKTCGNCDRGDPAVRFCKNCDSFQCKTCVDNHRHIRSLQNHKLLTLAEELHELSMSHKCCTKHGDCPAVSFCKDCDSFQCKTCVDKHRRVRSLKNHTLSNLAEEPQEEQSRSMFRKCCTKHEAQPMDRYCKEKACRVPMCALCAQHHHQDHDIADLEQVAKEIKTSMSDSSARVNDRYEELQNKKKTLEIAQKHLTSNFKIQEAEIEKCKKSLQELINSKFREAHANLKLKFDREMARLTKHIKSMDVVAAQMTSACDFTEKVCDVTPAEQILTFNHQISARLHELENKQLPEVIAKHTKFAFTGKHHSSMNLVRGSLHGICDTGWKLQVDPRHCTISHGKRTDSERYWGRKYEATIQTADMYGEKLIHGGVKIDVNTYWKLDRAESREESQSIDVTDNKDGTYTYHHYGTDVHVKISGIHIQGSPFKE